MGDQIQLPGPQLTVAQPDPVFPVPHRAWRRLRARVEALEDPIPWAQNLGWACVGIAPPAFLALIAWIPAYSLLPPNAQPQFAWITPTMIIIGIAAVVIAVICFVMNRDVQSKLRREAKYVVEDMDEIYAPHRQQTTATLDVVGTTTGQAASMVAETHTEQSGELLHGDRVRSEVELLANAVATATHPEVSEPARMEAEVDAQRAITVIRLLCPDVHMNLGELEVRLTNRNLSRQHGIDLMLGIVRTINERCLA